MAKNNQAVCRSAQPSAHAVRLGRPESATDSRPRPSGAQALGRALVLASSLLALPASAAPAAPPCGEGGVAAGDAGCGDAGMAPPDEEDPGGGGCGCFWSDELPEGSWALALPWPVMLVLRKQRKTRR